MKHNFCFGRRKRAFCLLWIVSVLLLISSFYIGRNIEKQKGQIGVRFSEKVLSGKRLEEVCEENDSSGQNGQLRITLWSWQEKKRVFAEEKDAGIEVKQIRLWGDVEQIYPECLSDGNTLSKADESGCMLSKKAAFQLFGGVEVVGKKVLFDGQPYWVRGILDVDDVLFVREEKDGYFSCMEAEGKAGNGTNPVRQFLLQMGISAEEGAIMEWDILRGILHLLRAFVVGILVFALVQHLEKRGIRDNAGAAQNVLGRSLWTVFAWIGAWLFFVLVLSKSWCFSQDFIPGSWSDFDFFSELFKAQQENYVRYLELPDVFKDHTLLRGFYLALGMYFVNLVCACAVWIKIRTDKNGLYSADK